MIYISSLSHSQCQIKIMAERNKSELILKTGQEDLLTENLSQFYKLHYQPRKSLEGNKTPIGFRAKSVNSIIQNKNPQQASNDPQVKHKKSLKERIKQHEKSKEKMRPQRKHIDKFSFKQALSKQTKNQQIAEYFSKFAGKTHVDLEEYSRKNIGVKLAIQKCKDQKLKIQKVISSNKQTEQTKLDYLQLKKKDIEDEIKSEIKMIYEQFFKKEYQEDGTKGYSDFQTKIRLAMDILHKQMFGK